MANSRVRIISARVWLSLSGSRSSGRQAAREIGDPQARLDLAQQQYAAVRGEPAVIETGDDFLAPTGDRLGRKGVVWFMVSWVRAGVVTLDLGTEILRHFNSLIHAHQPSNSPLMNNPG